MIALRKGCIAASCRNRLLMLLAAVCITAQLEAQINIPIGTGSATNDFWESPCPLQDWSGGSRAQYLYRASELVAAGMGPGNINTLSFTVAGREPSPGNDHTAIEQYSIKIGTTAIDELNLNAWVPGTAVVYGPVDYMPVTGVNTFTLSSPFFWNGSDNIVIEVCNGAADNNSTWYGSMNPRVVMTTALGFNASHNLLVDGQGSLCNAPAVTQSGEATYRPNVVFNWTAAPPCTGTPVAGTTIASAANVCLGESFLLSPMGATVASGLTYQWQSSKDNTTWADIRFATAFGYTATQDTSTWYRVKVSCSSGGAFAYSVPVQVTSPIFIQGVFTIDKNASPGAGILSSFNDAYNLIKCGIRGSVTFNVAPGSGPYNEQLVMQPVPGASAGKTVTFNGNGETLQYASSDNTARAVIKLDGADHIIFDSLVIQATGEYGYGVQIRNNADSNTISRCTILVDATSGEQKFAGIVINNSDTELMPDISAFCDGNLLSGNHITGGYCGIVLASSTAASNGRNTIRNNTVREFYKYGMYIRGSFMTLVQGNTFSRAARLGGDGEIHGIYATDLSSRLTINANTITHLLGGITARGVLVNGITLNQVKSLAGIDNLVSNNLVYSLGDRGGVRGISNKGSASVFYYNNTISIDGHDPATSFGADVMGYYQEPESENVTFSNNIITISRTGPGQKTALYFTSQAAGIASYRNNLYIFPGTGGTINIGHSGNADMPSLADWQTATGMDGTSFSLNPFYGDLSAGNLHPFNIAIDNTGIPVTQVPADIAGTARSVATPDLGAYEFTPPACVTPPVAGHIWLSKDTVCANSLVMLKLQGNSSGINQTFQWQVATAVTGPFANLGPVLSNPDTAIRVSAQAYYRVLVSCSGMNSYSDTAALTVRYSLPGGAYTINKNGGATDYKSFNEAKAAMACGIDDAVVFNVTPGSGVYEEQLLLEPVTGASAVATITFNGNGNTLHFSSDNSEERAVIKLNSADHIIFDSVTIDADGSGSYGFGVQLLNDADSNTFRKCTINIPFRGSDDHFAGIVVNGSAESLSGFSASWCDDNTFDNNTISGGYFGIAFVGNYDSPVFNNKVTNSNILDFYTTGVHLAYAEGTVVAFNKISRPTRKDVSDFDGVVSESNTNKLLVNGNRFFQPFGGNGSSTSTASGVSIRYSGAEAGKEMVISNNLVYDFGGMGEQYGFRDMGSNNVKFYHNTVSLDDVSSTATAYTTGFQISFASGVEWRNNIITITRGGRGEKKAMQLDGSAADWLIDHNDYYVNGAQAGNYIGYYNGGYTTLAAWQAAVGQDAHSLNIDPIYSRPSVGNFMPAISPMENTGDAAGIPADIRGVARSSTTPDIGAYEFTLSPCTTPPVAGATVITPNTGICMGATVELSLQGNSTGAAQTYQWQKSADGVSGWTNTGAPQYVGAYSTEVMHSDYFRCGVTCGASTVFSVPAQMHLNAGLAAGVYTIDNSGNGNFPSFSAAVAAMECGIEGPVTFEVKPGVFNEQVRMHRIAGATDTSRVTFRSATGVPGSVLLTYQATGDADNYVLQLDSASYITYRDITIQATGDSYGRAVHLLHTASYDSLLRCTVVSHATTTASEDMAAVYVNNYTGTGAVIKGNTIQQGAMGICLTGNYDAKLPRVVIDSNTVSGTYQYGIYAHYASHLVVTGDSVSLNTSLNSPAYGIFLEFCDSSLQVYGNRVHITNTATTVYGISLSVCNATPLNPVQVEANYIVAEGDNTGDVYGLAMQDNRNTLARNNVVSIHSSGTNAYGIYNASSVVRYENNTVHTTSTATGENYAACFLHWSSWIGASTLINNILSNAGGGKVLYAAFKELYGGDYNMLYTTGSTLAVIAGDSYTTLQEWVKASDQDFNSIVYKPAFVSDADLHPAVQDSTVWGMHGRGIQITGNDHDFNSSPRPVTLQAGVPDLGAYEFMPASLPPVAVAVPAVPAAGSRQTFLLGTDTVYTIIWGATAPQQLKVRRYSGVMPPALPAAAGYMYFYTDAEVTGAGAAGYTLEQHYLDPWRGFIDPETYIRLGRTKPAGEWSVDTASRTDIVYNIIREQNLDYLKRFTGLADSTVVPPKDNAYIAADSSNSGTRFWVAYGNHSFFKNTNAQEMLLYLSAREPANVTVRVNGTPWVRQYHIPANTVITSDLIPKSGVADARLMEEGRYDRGISIESDRPIVAYAHIYGSAASGATMLLPVGTYGYDYYSINSQQMFDDVDSYSWFYVVAAHDSTMVELTPTNPTLGGRTANVPFTVMLNKGEVYQVLGAEERVAGPYRIGYDLTGSHVRSVKNASGKCYPVAVFSGSGRTSISCDFSGGGGDNIMQQNFPSQAWGKRYLTAPTSVSLDPADVNPNIFRIAVKNPATVVKRNGQVLTDLINHYYYEYISDTADYIEADQPIMVAQYMTSEGKCNSRGSGDPEMFYLSPIEQGIKEVYFYRNSEQSITVNYLTLIIPDNGLKSLLIDGAATFDRTYPHPGLPGYTVVVKRWDAARAQVAVSSDSAFTAITYGQGSVESYGYNAGTLVKNLNAVPGFINVFDSGAQNSAYTCVGTPFRLHIAIPVKPATITWKFSEAAGLTPHADSVQVNPKPFDSTMVNGRMLYHYTVIKDFTFSETGIYYIPVEYQHPDIESCDNTSGVMLEVKVIDKPAVDFTVSYSGCLNDQAQFHGTATASNGTPVNKWKWDFDDNTGSGARDTVKRFTGPGTFGVKLRVTGEDGCIADTVKPVVANAYAALNFVNDSLVVCEGTPAMLSVLNPETGIIYDWYDAPTGGIALYTGASYTISSVTQTVTLYVTAVKNGCASPREKAMATILTRLAKPVVTVDSLGTNMVRFQWNAVPGAKGYEVSADNGVSWTQPSSGTTGLTHTITGLRPAQEVSLLVKAKGDSECQDTTADIVKAVTLQDKVFIPNAFSPNGDGLNDVVRVYGAVIKEMRFSVFNQWGEKVFETRDLNSGWDGSYKGKPQPSGVYMYVCQLVLADGATQTKKGAINLVR